MLRVGDGTFRAIANTTTTTSKQIEKVFQFASRWSSYFIFRKMNAAITGPPRTSSGLYRIASTNRPAAKAPTARVAPQPGQCKPVA